MACVSVVAQTQPTPPPTPPPTQPTQIPWWAVAVAGGVLLLFIAARR